MGNILPESIVRPEDHAHDSPRDDTKESPKFLKTMSMARAPTSSQKFSTQKIIHILLLGTGMSGKSTFFLQYQILKNTLSQNHRLLYRNLVYRNVILNMLEVMEGCINTSPDNPFASQEALSIYQSLKERLTKQGFEGIESLTHVELAQTNKVFEDSKFVERLQSHQGFRYFDNIDFFFSEENRKRIFDPDYMPSNEDMLLCRKKTTGVTKTKFTTPISDLMVELTDVGGQRSRIQ